MIPLRKKKKQLNKAARVKQRQLMTSIGVVVLTMACAGGVALMSILNSEPAGGRYTYTTENDIWYVEDGSVEVAAAQVDAPQPTFTPQPTATPKPTPTVEVFLPTPEPTAQSTPEPETIVITAAGDCTLGHYRAKGGRASNFKKAFENNGPDYFFQNFRELFSQDDLTIVNLEGPLTSYNKKRPNRTFNFRGYPEYVDILTSGSVEICNLANNHALDYQEEGFKDTYNNLTQAGIGASGYGPEYFTVVNGYTVGSVGYTEWNFEVDDILESVAEAAENCDLLIVSMHWNEEHEYKLSKYCRKMGRALIDAGADIVIGNHSHVIGEIEQYNGKYIINSLGNFCFGGNDDPHVRECVVFRQKFIMHWDGTVEDGGIDLIPALISSTEAYNDFQPRIATPEEGREIVYAIGGLSDNLDPEQIRWLEDGYVMRNGLLPGTTPQVTAAPTPAMEIVQDIAR